jgi:uncharacterized protein YndB with AHSA1/START domain
MPRHVEPIQCGILIRAPPKRVWDALATSRGLDAWFTAGAEVDARPGGSIRFRWRGWGPDRVTGEDGGPVLEAETQRRLVFQWRPDSPDYATTVRIELEEAGGGTVVRVHEDGYRDTPSGRRAQLDCAAGWGEALALLKMYLEHGLRY